MTFFEGILLGLVQGLAEFLPISSSGHLAILQQLFGIDGEQVLLFAVLLHLGTLLSLFAVYWKDILLLFKELFSLILDLLRGKGLCLENNETRKLGVMIIVATIPTAVIGLLFNDLFAGLYNSLTGIAIGLLITGTFLFFIERIASGKKAVKEMRYRDAILVGLFQSIAIAPGISRSGATITGSLLCGLNRETAVRFAFLISIPSILGAVVLEAPDALAEGLAPSFWGPVLLGMAVAAVTGYAAIKLMIRVVSNRKLTWFSYYTWGLGILVLLLTMTL
ncbi:MAG: undecaprenyl-diphosphatase [Firmicutes bacterium HGW-Firmicutes-11]|nr:MAG: undecaprenyl-diphosphatase [Firmicutes bacterium HGW-Firmicutes-11]